MKPSITKDNFMRYNAQYSVSSKSKPINYLTRSFFKDTNPLAMKRRKTVKEKTLIGACSAASMGSVHLKANSPKTTFSSTD